MILLIWFVASFVLYLLITVIVDAILLGKLSFRLVTKNDFQPYRIADQNRIDIQTGLQCSAFSAAYVLRHFGIDVDGNTLYSVMPHKLKSGYVYPKGIKALLQSYGISVQYCRGNLSALKMELQKGHPVIVMIRVRKDKPWLHYVPVIGYDEEHLFIAESLPELVNCQCDQYNRKIGNTEFLQLWNTAMVKQPFYKNTYFSYTSENRQEH